MNVKSLLYLIVAAICLPTESAANTNTGEHPKAFLISYENKALLRQKGDSLFVINIDLEWPEVINFSPMPSLQRYLCHALLGVNASSFTMGMNKMLAAYGHPINALPDNDAIKKVYVNLSLKQIITDNKYRYTTMHLFRRVCGAKTTDTPIITNSFFTYNLVSGRVLSSEDIIKKQYLPGGYAHNDLVYNVMSNADEEAQKTVDIDSVPASVFLIPGGVGFSLGMVDTFTGSDHIVALSTDMMKPVLKGDIKKMLKNEKIAAWPGTTSDSSFVQLPHLSAADNQPICSLPDSAASYPGGKVKLMQFISNNMNGTNAGITSAMRCRMLLKFIVEADGSLSHIHVLSPVYPAFDREVVSVLSTMPKWQPAKKSNKPVRSQYVLPLSFDFK